MGTSAATFQYFGAPRAQAGPHSGPQIGWPASGVESATVVARSAAQADALATAFFILGPKKGRGILPEPRRDRCDPAGSKVRPSRSIWTAPRVFRPACTNCPPARSDPPRRLKVSTFAKGRRMNGISRFFLILLRIAIGWHFLFEGIEKVESMRRGMTETSRPFSSAGYLNEASGPAELASSRSRLAIRIRRPSSGSRRSQRSPNAKPPSPAANIFRPARQGMGGLLPALWRILWVSKSPGQMEKARAEFEKAKDKAGLWLVQGRQGRGQELFASRVQSFPCRPRSASRTSRKSSLTSTSCKTREIPLFNKDVEKARLQVAKAEAAQLRNELLADLKQPIDEALARRADARTKGHEAPCRRIMAKRGASIPGWSGSTSRQLGTGCGGRLPDAWAFSLGHRHSPAPFSC